MKHFCIIIFFLFTAEKPVQHNLRDTIAKNKPDMVNIDSTMYQLPIKSSLDNQVDKMDHLKDEAKKLYNKSLDLEDKVNEVKKQQDLNELLLSLKKNRNQ